MTPPPPPPTPHPPPTVSIFTPTHDSSFLRQVYESIKDQPFHEWIVVCNNGGEPIDFHDERVKMHLLYKAVPWCGALKKHACAKASGEILLELDHDDLLMPGAVAKVQAAFVDPEIGFVYSNTINATGDFQKVPRYSEGFGWRYREIEFRGQLLDECIAFPPTPEAVSRIWFAPNHLRAFRRSVYEAVGGYSDQMRVLDDQDLMCRLFAVTRFHHIDEPLYLYRIHGENAWLKHNQEIQDNVYRLYDQYIEAMVMGGRLEGLKLDLGGRLNSPPEGNFTSVDLKNADVIADLNRPWPFADSSVAVLRAFDVFEHLRDPLHTMRECHRVLRPGGWLMGQVPSTDGRGAFQDPTHVSFWNQNSFLYYTHREWAKYIDTPVRFQAPRLFTTAKDQLEVSWVKFHLIALKDGYRPPGPIDI